jgi:hypothetical protein
MAGTATAGNDEEDQMRYVDLATRREWIARLQEHARAHYNEGWDTFVECYGEEEWFELVDTRETFEHCMALCETLVSVWMDRRADAQAEIRAGIGDAHWQL